MLKKFLLCSFLFLLSYSAYAKTAIQNITPYTFTLTSVVLKNAVCTQCVVKSTLIPQGVTNYQFTSSTGQITLDYDVRSGTKYMGHITLSATPTGVTLLNGAGATIINSGLAYQILYTPIIPFWEGKFSDLTNWRNNNWNVVKLPSWGEKNIEVKSSTASPKEASPTGDNYLRVHYPAGSANSASSPPLPLGGSQFYGNMINSATPITLSFFIRYPTNFPFVGKERPLTVGKLPGLYGGIGNTGTNVPTGYDGWTTRFMWCDYTSSKQKVKGGGQVLQFTYGSNTGLTGTKNGVFLGCGSWGFKADGLWHNVQQTIFLNDVGKANGRIDVCYDGKPVFSQTGITFRLTSSLQISGILFQTFFGGSSKEYSTPINTYADFAGFALYKYPTPATPGLCITNLPGIK